MEQADEEKPLDPAAEMLRRKMIRLLVVSIGGLLIGVMAVLGAVVYRIGETGRAGAFSGATASTPFEGRIALPGGGEILSASLDGARMLVQVRLEGGARQFLIYDLDGGALIAKVAVD